MPGLVPTGIPTGTGSLYQKEVTTSIGAGASYVLPAGNYWVIAVGANCKLQVIDSTGTWNDITAVNVLPAGVVNSDGASVRYNNGGGGAQNIKTILIG